MQRNRPQLGAWSGSRRNPHQTYFDAIACHYTSIIAEYLFNCVDPQRLKEVEVELSRSFPGINRLMVQHYVNEYLEEPLAAILSGVALSGLTLASIPLGLVLLYALLLAALPVIESRFGIFIALGGPSAYKLGLLRVVSMGGFLIGTTPAVAPADCRWRLACVRSYEMNRRVGVMRAARKRRPSTKNHMQPQFHPSEDTAEIIPSTLTS